MKKIEAIVKPFKLDEVRDALNGAGLTGMTVTEVRGRGRQSTRPDSYRGLKYTYDLMSGMKLEVVVADGHADQVVRIITTTARTGRPGSGTIFVSPLDDSIRIRTGEHGQDGL